MTTKETRRVRSTSRTRSPKHQRPAAHRPSTWEPFAAPDGAITLEEWRRTIAKAPAVHVVALHDHLVA